MNLQTNRNNTNLNNNNNTNSNNTIPFFLFLLLFFFFFLGLRPGPAHEVGRLSVITIGPVIDEATTSSIHSIANVRSKQLAHE